MQCDLNLASRSSSAAIAPQELGALNFSTNFPSAMMRKAWGLSRSCSGSLGSKAVGPPVRPAYVLPSLCCV